MICGVSQPPKTIKWPPGLAIKIAAGFLGVAPIADMGLAFRGAHVIYAFKHSLWMGLWMVVMSSWMGWSWAFGPSGGGLEIYPLLKRSIATWPR